MLYIYGNRFHPKMLGSTSSHQKKKKQQQQQQQKNKEKQDKTKQQLLTIPRYNKTFWLFFRKFVKSSFSI